MIDATPKPADQCQEQVWDQEEVGPGYKLRNCKRKATDGQYCKQHAKRRRLWALRAKQFERMHTF